MNPTVQQLNAKYGTPPSNLNLSGLSSNSANTPANNSFASIFAASNGQQAQQQTQVQSSLGDKIANDLKNRGTSAANDITNPQEGNALTRGVKAAGEAFGGITDVATEGLKSVIPQAIQDNFMKVPQRVTDAQNAKDNAPANPLQKAIASWAQQHPDAYNGLKNTLESLSAGGQIAGTVAAGEAVPDTGISKVSEIPSTIKQTGKEFLGDTQKVGETVVKKGQQAIGKGGSGTDALQKEFDTIQEKISPKPTAKEVKLAQSQGRVVKGKEPTLLKSGTPDTLAPTKETQRAIGTIQREIPGAAKMDEPTLHDALKDTISQKAEALKPEMQKVQIKPSTIEKINEDWGKLKSSQVKNARATEEPNVIKRQGQFEAILKKSQSGNMNDLWETAKNYDDSIPNSVKKANDLSPRDLQDEKQEWLDNRSILKDAINDSKTGLGKISKQAFSDMHDMYNAKENLVSKAELDFEGQPSKLHQAITGKTAKTIGAIGVLTGATAYGIPKVVKAATGQ